jgi:hypothetical protein
MATLDHVLELLWEHTAERIEKLAARSRQSASLERVLLDRAEESERRLIANIQDWEAYPPNACSCPPKKADWHYRLYSRSCMRGDHRREAMIPGMGVD